MDCEILSLPQSGSKAKRLKLLREHFEKSFKCIPHTYVRAPGRINVIGEHIDYCGYAVLPMAIDQDVLVAVAERDDTKLCISNMDDNYKGFECDINTFVIADVKHDWYKYVLCGVQGIRDLKSQVERLKGLSVCVTGAVPPGSGLSSSSALVCAAALAVLHSCRVPLSLLDLAELCTRAERHIGTESGGMDQAASLLSKAGSAQVIEFGPLRCTSVILPRGAMFVVANSLVEKRKASGAEYNTRVVECRLAARIIAAKFGVPMRTNLQLGELQRLLNKNFEEMIAAVKETIHPEAYSKEELCRAFGMSETQLNKQVLSANTFHLSEFELQKRSLHVFSEGSRVWQFKRVCDTWKERGGGAGGEDEQRRVLEQLGRLMSESHDSTRHLYECSHPALDKLVDMSKGIAFGARLTGAGWGGCIIALVAKSRVNEYQELLKRDYYQKEGLKVDDWSSVLFSTEPSRGAFLYDASQPVSEERRRGQLVQH